jgi:hypothetical protein
MHQVVKDRIDLCCKWQKPRDKREPYTFQMLETFHQLVTKAESHSKVAFLDQLSLIFDTQCLGVFTGSRVSEYAQSKGKVDSVSKVPSFHQKPNDDANAVAFIAGDFMFLDAKGSKLSHETLFKTPDLAVQMQITFRHDKSGRNYSVRKYGRGNSWMCPITAAIRILHRAHMLRIPSNDPICAYRNPRKGKHRWLRDSEVTSTMRKICVATYPDETHFLRVHIKRISSHSARITAAVALHHAGMTIDDIAQRLRWKPESVAFYLRETSQDIGLYTINTIFGAQRAFL